MFSPHCQESVFYQYACPAFLNGHPSAALFDLTAMADCADVLDMW